MRQEVSVDLADFTELRQTVEGRPPAIVHATALLVTAILMAAAVWSVLTKANLVVRAAGRIRPITSPELVFTSVSSSIEGRIAEVTFKEGDEVQQGDVLIRLDTEQLENELAKRRRTIEADREELAKLDELEKLQSRRFAAAKSKAEAELAEAIEEKRRLDEKQASEIRVAQLELDAALDNQSRQQELVERNAATLLQLLKAKTRVEQARECLLTARLPLSEGKIDVLQRSLELLAEERAVEQAELEMQRAAKQGEIEAARKELANLEIQQQRASLRAPCDGVVTAGDLKVGNILEPGKPVVEIAPKTGFLFEITVRNEDVGHLREGMPARIKFDAYDFQRYGTLEGTVSFISPDSKVSQSTADKRTAFYTVRIELHGTELGRDEYRGQVKLGMGGRAEIITGRESIAAFLIKRIQQTISLS